MSKGNWVFVMLIIGIFVMGILAYGCNFSKPDTTVNELWYNANTVRITSLDLDWFVANPDSVGVVTAKNKPGIVGIFRFIPIARLQQGGQ